MNSLHNYFFSRIALGLAFLLLLSSWKAGNKEPDSENVFDHIRPSFELMEFISNADFIEDENLARNGFIEDLRKKEIQLLPLASLQANRKAPHSRKEVLQLETKNGSHRVDILENPDKEYLFSHWKNSLSEAGIKDEIKNDGGGAVFLKVKTEENSAVGAIFYTGRNVFNIAISIPFPVPESYDKLDSASRQIINNSFKELYSVLESIAKNYVAPYEFVFYPSHNKRLSRDQRMYGLIQFWTEVKYNFAFFDQVPDLNWDHVLTEYLPVIEKDQSNEEYYKHMKKMCALLKDGHTNIYPPHSVESAFDAPALRLINISSKAIVENVEKSLEKEVPVGSQIIGVNNVPVEKYLKEKVFPYISSSTEHILFDWGIRDLLKGERGTSVEVVFITPDGKEKQLVLERNSRNSKVEWVKQKDPWKLFEFKRLPGDVAYVALNSFGPEQIVQEFKNHIDTINSCKGLIIDLRANGGGNSGNGYKIIEHLTDKPFLTSRWRTRDHKPAYKAWGKFAVKGHRDQEAEEDEWEKRVTDYYKGERWYTEAADTIVPPKNAKINLPLVVLAGHNTASAAEDFLIALDGLKIATVVGDRTFGSTGQPLMLDLPGGGRARICTKRDEYPDGRQFVGYGIEPGIYVINTLGDFLEENDATLKKGLEIVPMTKGQAREKTGK